MFRLKNSFLFVFILIIGVSCDGFKIPENIFDTSERAKYERRYSGPDSLMTRWKTEFMAATQNKLQINDGYSFTVSTVVGRPNALGYLVELQKGDQLIIEVTTENPEKKIFIDVFEQASDTETSKSELIKNGSFSRSIETSGLHRIIIQPEIEFSGTFPLKIYTQPSFGFPVAGKTNRDVHSFWGASRDGGGRSHEGVDIFASRGTPVIAATNGYITRTGNSGLGGKQVWQRDGIFGSSLYYAHLDSIIITDGSQVKTGDTLGLVGSTGNAEGGAPHLHFGIYATEGAVDPYPYIRARAVPKSKAAQIPRTASVKSGSNLRSGPGTKYEIVAMIADKISAHILAGDGEWFHIKTGSGLEGFIISGRLD